MRSIEASLNEVFPLRLGDKGLELGRSEGVDEAGFGDNEKEDLSAGESGELIGLWMGESGGYDHLWKKNYLFHNACK